MVFMVNGIIQSNLRHKCLVYFYTSPKGISQSMSRRGNCLDNAPIESFFGHMKNEIELDKCNKYFRRSTKSYKGICPLL